MFSPNYKELTCKCKVVRRVDDDGTRFVPDLPDLQFGLVLCFVDGVNHYAYPLPASAEGKDCICHVVYKSKDDEAMQKFAGKIGLGNAVCKTPEYKSIVTATVASVKIAEEKARLIAEVEAKGEVVKQSDLDAVKYVEADKDDGQPLWIFQTKEYVDH